MGGMSFKCPNCERWFLEKSALHQHLIDKHQEPRGFSLSGVASAVKIIHPTSKNPFTPPKIRV